MKLLSGILRIVIYIMIAMIGAFAGAIPPTMRKKDETTIIESVMQATARKDDGKTIDFTEIR